MAFYGDLQMLITVVQGMRWNGSLQCMNTRPMVAKEHRNRTFDATGDGKMRLKIFSNTRWEGE